MKTIVLSESGFDKFKGIMNESYGDKALIVKKYLDDNFMRATLEQDGNVVGIFIKLSNHVPTEKRMWKQDVLDILEREYNKIISDEKERGSFLSQAIDDWYYNKFTNSGNLSTYNF